MRARRRAEEEAAREWHGAYAPYDLVREFVIALGVVALLAIGLTVLFSSPDERPSTIAQWSRQMPSDFLATAVTELDGSSGTAGYGPPYNHNASGQHIAFVRLQKWLGVSHPIVGDADRVQCREFALLQPELVEDGLRASQISKAGSVGAALSAQTTRTTLAAR